MRMDLYSHESLCPYSVINHQSTNGHLNNSVDLEGSGCRGCPICDSRSRCFSHLSEKVSNNFTDLSDVINNLTNMIRRQDEEIKELKLRLERIEDNKEAGCIDLNKLNHNVNTQIDLDLLIKSQEPASKGFFNAGHFNTIAKVLPNIKEFYEHRDWKLLANLGFLQIYTKPSEEDKYVNILGRCEINHKVADIGNEIYNQNIFLNEDPNVTATEVLQKIDTNINMYYTQFKKFLVSENADVVYLSQKIENPPEYEDESIVIPIVSVNHYKKKVTDDFERLNIKIGGWVLKSLGTHKTLVNVFFDVQIPKTDLPEILLSKHAKSLIAMLRTLESSCNKTYFNYHFGSKIFEKTQTMVMDENYQSKSYYEERKEDRKDEEEVGEYIEKEETKVQTENKKPSKHDFTIVPCPKDVPDIDPATVPEEQRQYIIGTRSRLGMLLDLINKGDWKQIANKKECRIFVKKGESGLTCVKGETYFPFDAEKIIEYIKRADIRAEYDKHTETAHIITEYEHRTFLAYAKIKRILVVASRDITFATQLITSEEEQTMYTPTYSVDLPDYPEQNDPIRASLPIGGWVIKKTDDGGSHIVYANELDLKGNLPAFMIEKTADIQISVVTALRDYMMKKEGVKKGEVWVRPESEMRMTHQPNLSSANRLSANLPVTTKPLDTKLNTSAVTGSIVEEEEKKEIKKPDLSKTFDRNSAPLPVVQVNYFLLSNIV